MLSLDFLTDPRTVLVKKKTHLFCDLYDLSVIFESGPCPEIFSIVCVLVKPVGRQLWLQRVGVKHVVYVGFSRASGQCVSA